MDLILPIFPILALAFAGFLTARSGFLQQSDCEALAKFTFNLVIPCLLFINISRSEIPADFGLTFLSAFYGSVLLMFVASLFVSRFMFQGAPKEQAVFAMGTSYSNTTIVGIPLTLQTLGPDAMLPLFLIIALQNLVLFTVGTIAAEREAFDWSSLLGTVARLTGQLFRNPLTASLMAGLIFNLLNLSLWEPLENSVRLMSTAAIPLALFVLGTSLYQYRLRGQIAPALVMSCMKVLLLPVVVYLMSFHVFTLDPLWATTAVLASAMPVGISAYVFSSRYQVSQAAVAAGSLISTLLCLLPVLLILAWVRGTAA